jgi:UDP-N-acetylmuramoyl-tripeptide--D-alanyl-D-alanine ligase
VTGRQSGRDSTQATLILGIGAPVLETVTRTSAAGGQSSCLDRSGQFAGFLSPRVRGAQLTFGLGAGAQVRAEVSARDVRFRTPAGDFTVALQVAGEHNVRNALAACAAAHALGVPPEAMRAGLASFPGVPGRLQRRHAAPSSWVIDDSYNANPESMKAAIRVLAAERGRKVFVMGDMGDLGAGAAAMHAEVGAFARQAGVDALLALGPASSAAVEAFGAGARHFPDIASLTSAALEEARAGATLLVKGSRYMHMERVADALCAQGGPDAV